jgi:hypothetical protein
MPEARNAAALSFMIGGMYTLDGYSTLNSSPWTAQNFGADPEAMSALKKYVTHSVVFSLAFTATGSYLDNTWWPLIGSVAANIYLVWLYHDAARKGANAGRTGWGQTAKPQKGPVVWRGGA